jgi:hypothetical protein
MPGGGGSSAGEGLGWRVGLGAGGTDGGEDDVENQWTAVMHPGGGGSPLGGQAALRLFFQLDRVQEVGLDGRGEGGDGDDDDEEEDRIFVHRRLEVMCGMRGCSCMCARVLVSVCASASVRVHLRTSAHKVPATPTKTIFSGP